jgi:hypothetical protein
MDSGADAENTDRADDDEINGHDVIQQARYRKDKDARNQGDHRTQSQIYMHGKAFLSLEFLVDVIALGFLLQKNCRAAMCFGRTLHTSHAQIFPY